MKGWKLVKGGEKNKFVGRGQQKERVWKNKISGTKMRVVQVSQQSAQKPYKYYIDTEDYPHRKAHFHDETTNQREAISTAVDWMRNHPAGGIRYRDS